MFQSLMVISVQFSKLNHSLTISILFTALKEDTLEIVTSQGIRIKRREMALVWHEKASRSALQTSPLSHMPNLAFWYRHNMTTVKEIAEQCRQLWLSLNNEKFIVNFNQIIFFKWKFDWECWYITCILNLFLSKQLTINKCTLLDCTKYRDSYVLYKPTVHNFGMVSLHTLFWYRHTHTWRFRPLVKTLLGQFSLDQITGTVWERVLHSLLTEHMTMQT